MVITACTKIGECREQVVGLTYKHIVPQLGMTDRSK